MMKNIKLKNIKLKQYTSYIVLIALTIGFAIYSGSGEMAEAMEP